jgi:hypothetical protein
MLGDDALPRRRTYREAARSASLSASAGGGATGTTGDQS